MVDCSAPEMLEHVLTIHPCWGQIAALPNDQIERLRELLKQAAAKNIEAMSLAICNVCFAPRKRTGNERPSMSAKFQKQPSTVRGGIPGMPAYGNWHTRGEILPLHWSVDGKLVLQILFDRGISDRHEDQCSLKARDELVVFDRIDGCSRCSAPACLLGAITSGRVPTLGGAMIDYLTCLGWNLLGPSRLIRAGCPLMIKR